MLSMQKEGVGFHGYTPLSHLGQSWATVSHLGQTERNNTIDTLGSASENST